MNEQYYEKIMRRTIPNVLTDILEHMYTNDLTKEAEDNIYDLERMIDEEKDLTQTIGKLRSGGSETYNRFDQIFNHSVNKFGYSPIQSQ